MSRRPRDISADAMEGLAVEPARSDHQHQGLHSVIVGSDYVLGDVTMVGDVAIKLALANETLTFSFAPTGDIDFGPYQVRAEQFYADMADGTPPFIVNSTTLVDNLNADLLDGNEATDFAAAIHATQHEDGGGDALTGANIEGIVRGAIANVSDVIEPNDDICMNGHRICFNVSCNTNIQAVSETQINFNSNGSLNFTVTTFGNTFYKTLNNRDAIRHAFGNAGDATLGWETAEQTDMFKIFAKSGAFIFSQFTGNAGLNKYGASPPPAMSVVIQADDAVAAHRIELGHDATDSWINSVTGDIKMLKTTTAPDFAKTGWPLTPDVTLSFDDANRRVTVTDGGSAYYYVDGVRYTLGGNKTVDITDTEGLWYIYFVGATLTASQSIWSFSAEDKALVAIVYWDAANNKHTILGYELHSFVMDGANHARLHYGGGAAWESGLLVSDAGSEVVDVSAGDIWDEDLNIPISDGAGAALFEQVLSPAEMPVYYRSGASDWRIYETADKGNATDAGYVDGSNNLHYNKLNGTWASTIASAANHVAYWVIATNDQTEPVALIMGQREDTTLAQAKSNNVFSGLSLAGLPFEEMVVLARLILKETGGGLFYTLEDIVDLRATNISGSVTSPLITDHGGLGGLADDDHAHYILVDGTRAFTGDVELGANGIGNDNPILTFAAGADGKATLTGALDITGSAAVNVAAGGRATLYLSEAGTGYFGFAADYGPEQVLMMTQTSLGRQVILTDVAYVARNFDHAPQNDPTLFIHSLVDPDDDNTQWISFSHDRTDGVIAVGSGILDLPDVRGDSLVFTDGGSTVDIIRDEDDMASDDDAALATQQSIKKYVDDNAGGGGGYFDGYAKVSDVKAANTSGGTFTAGAWQTRVLNTEDSDPQSMVSLASNQFTLAAGTYVIRATAPAYAVNRHKAKLRNITDGADTLIGTSEYAGSNVVSTHSIVAGLFTIAATKAFELQHRCQTTGVTIGFGVGSNFGVTELYAVVEIWRLA